ncbi:class I SAM-dependent methyltransferase [Candidatus Peregrinibacteria bacterium]|nr:class I SAM-dependent methyltransferase [Candidatus Peregrinibacteria bacterium]
MGTNIQSHIFYNFFSFLYDRLITWNGYKKSITHFIHRLSLPNKRLKILDAGCGTGLISFALAEKNPNAEIIGFDYSSKMIESAEKINKLHGFQNIKFYIGDIENIIPLKNLRNNNRAMDPHSFDFIFVAGALEYTDFPKGIEELCKFLKIGGTLYNIAVKNNWKGKLLGYFMGFTPYSKTKMIKIFQTNGLQKIEEMPFLGKEEQKASNFKIVLKAIN